MPVFPEDRFVDAVEQVVKANAAWVPPFGSGATLYIRPYMIATNAVIGVKPADEYQFRILVTPVMDLTSRAAQSQLQSVFLILTVQHLTEPDISKRD